MANSLQQASFIPTGLEIVPYQSSYQEASEWRISPSMIIPAVPISSWKPEEELDEVEMQANGSMKKRRRWTPSEFEEEVEKDFSLLEIYKSNNIQVINLNRENGETTLDPQELLKNLKGWTIEKRKRPEKNGKRRVDKIYRHPKSKRILRSLVEVTRFIEENSYLRKASDYNGEGGSQVNRPTLADQSTIYTQLFEMLKETLSHKVQGSNVSPVKKVVPLISKQQQEYNMLHKSIDGQSHIPQDKNHAGPINLIFNSQSTQQTLLFVPPTTSEINLSINPLVEVNSNSKDISRTCTFVNIPAVEELKDNQNLDKACHSSCAEKIEVRKTKGKMKVVAMCDGSPSKLHRKKRNKSKCTDPIDATDDETSQHASLSDLLGDEESVVKVSFKSTKPLGKLNNMKNKMNEMANFESFIQGMILGDKSPSKRES